jgi:MarR family transcriptional regulator for hemolysin
MFGTEYRRLMKPLGLSAPQLRMIIQLQRSDGLSQSTIARLLAVGKVTVSGLVGRMEAGGWIERRCDPKDRRKKLIYLTDKARTIEQQAVSQGIDLTHKTLLNLDRQQRSDLVELLLAVKNNLLLLESSPQEVTQSDAAVEHSKR